jgi:hypothetical protein
MECEGENWHRRETRMNGGREVGKEEGRKAGKNVRGKQEGSGKRA